MDLLLSIYLPQTFRNLARTEESKSRLIIHLSLLVNAVFIKNLDLVANSQFIKLDEKGLINPLEDRSKF